MKKIIILATAVLMFVACGGNEKNQNHGTHVHEDGTEHQSHDVETTVPTQESFKVEIDTAESGDAEHLYEHGHSHNHPHQH